MEFIHSPTAVYLAVRVLYESAICRVLVGQDEHKKLFILNQLQDRALIKRHLHDFDGGCTDFKEGFTFRDDFYVVFRYHTGQTLTGRIENKPMPLLALCLALCKTAQTEDLPVNLLHLLMHDERFVMVEDGGIRLNKVLTFMQDGESWGETQAASQLALLLFELIARSEMDCVQKYTLKVLSDGLLRQFNSLLELYLFVKNFSEQYEPHNTKELIGNKWKRLQSIALLIYEKAGFWLAAALVLVTAVLAIGYFLEPKEPEVVPIFSQLGGRMLNERGAIEDGYFETQTNHR